MSESDIPFCFTLSFYRILSAALTNFSSARIDLRAMKLRIAATAGNADVISMWKFIASGANCLLTTTMAKYHNNIVKIFTIHKRA